MIKEDLNPLSYCPKKLWFIFVQSQLLGVAEASRYFIELKK